MFGISSAEQNPLNLLLQFTEHALVQPLELPSVILIVEEEVNLINHDYSQRGKINRLSRLAKVSECSKC